MWPAITLTTDDLAHWSMYTPPGRQELNWNLFAHDERYHHIKTIFCFPGHLWGECTGHQSVPLTNDKLYSYDLFEVTLGAVEQTVELPMFENLQNLTFLQQAETAKSLHGGCIILLHYSTNKKSCMIQVCFDSKQMRSNFLTPL